MILFRVLWAVLRVSRRATHAAVFIALIATSTVSSITLFYAYGFYNYHEVVETSLPENTIVVSSLAIAPFTSFIDADKVREIVRGIPGVRGVGEEVVVLGFSDGHAFIVRGVDRTIYSIISSRLKLVAGLPWDNCIGCVWLGEEVSGILGKKPGDIITLCSLFTGKCKAFLVKGVYRGEPPYRYEILTNIETARDMRGLYRGQASLVLVFLRQGTSPREVLKKFNITVGEVGLFSRLFIALKRIGSRYAAKVYYYASNVYLARLGLQKNIIVLFGLVTAFLSSLSNVVIGGFFWNRLGEETIVLRILGVSRKSLRLSSILLLVFYASGASILGYYLAQYLCFVLDLWLLGYPLAVIGSTREAMGVVALTSILLSIYGAVIGLGGKDEGFD